GARAGSDHPSAVPVPDRVVADLPAAGAARGDPRLARGSAASGRGGDRQPARCGAGGVPRGAGRSAPTPHRPCPGTPLMAVPARRARRVVDGLGFLTLARAWKPMPEAGVAAPIAGTIPGHPVGPAAEPSTVPTEPVAGGWAGRPSMRRTPSRRRRRRSGVSLSFLLEESRILMADRVIHTGPAGTGLPKRTAPGGRERRAAASHHPRGLPRRPARLPRPR